MLSYHRSFDYASIHIERRLFSYSYPKTKKSSNTKLSIYRSVKFISLFCKYDYKMMYKTSSEFCGKITEVKGNIELN